MDKKSKLREALNRFAQLDYSHTPVIRYERIDALVAEIEALAKDISLNLFQKVVDVIKAKEAVETAEKEAKTQEEIKAEPQPTNVETEVKKDEQQG